MQLPEEILNKIMEIAYNINKKEISQNFRKISDKYIGEKKGESLLSKDEEAIAYSIARMPATYGAVRESSSQMLELFDSDTLNSVKTLIDVGAGTGAATLALIDELKKSNISINNITCLEREDAMIKLGKTLFEASDIEVIKNASWVKFDINANTKNITFENNKNVNEPIDSMNADIVITSYMLNEFPEEKVIDVVDKLWNMTNNILIIVDPGTPKDHKRLVKIKNHLSEKGGNIIAPCTCKFGCDLPETDWCHFTCRVERTRLQKQAKGGEVPFEDEKFTYLVVSKKWNRSHQKVSRIIRHPVIRPNMIEIKMCSNGEIVSKIYTKKDKEAYKRLKKAKVGNIIVE